MEFNWAKKVIEKYSHLTENEWKTFLNYAKTIKLKPKEEFFKAGEVADKAGFLKNGILRAYQLDEDGNISTSYFYYTPKNDVVTLHTSFSQNQPSEHTVEAITDCEILYIEKEDILYLYNNFHTFEKLGHKIAEKHYLEGSKRINSLQTKNAKQRYYEFLEESPELILKVPQNMIASYLGISQFTLSKIKNE